MRWRLCCSVPLSRDIQFLLSTKPGSHGSHGDLPQRVFSFSLVVPFAFLVLFLSSMNNSYSFKHKIVLANSTRFASWKDPSKNFIYPLRLKKQNSAQGRHFLKEEGWKRKSRTVVHRLLPVKRKVKGARPGERSRINRNHRIKRSNSTRCTI